MIQLNEIFISPNDFFQNAFFNSLRQQHCKSARKLGCYRSFFWDMDPYIMEMGAGIACFYRMFLSIIKDVTIRVIVMVIVPIFCKCSNRYAPLWFHEKSKFLMFPNAEVDILDGQYRNDLTRIYNLIACQKNVDLSIFSKTCI